MTMATKEKPKFSQAIPVSAVQAELEKIRAQHKGMLRPSDVVSFAKNPKTALHARFQWDDTKAAEQYRLEQARDIIRAIVTILPNTNQPVRAYVALQEDRGEGSYRATLSVLSDKELRQQLLKEARIDMLGFQKKYSILEELSQVFEAMRKVS